MIMRGEQRFCADLIVQMLNDAPRERKPVERARAAADFVQHDQAARGGVVQNIRRLGHLNHERGLPA